jgi:hypothetical protein
VWAIAEDHVNPKSVVYRNGVWLFFSIDGGQKWIQLKGGLPTIAVRDLNIQNARTIWSSPLLAAAFTSR